MYEGQVIGSEGCYLLVLCAVEGISNDGIVMRVVQIKRQPVFLVLDRVTFAWLDGHAAIGSWRTWPRTVVLPRMETRILYKLTTIHFSLTTSPPMIL